MAPRVHITPRGISAEHTARRLGLTLAEFNGFAPELFARGFPRPDVTTGRYDRRAVDAWMDRQSGMAPAPQARDARDVVPERLEAMRHGAR